MDSKHRHELEQNELAKWITAQYEDWIRPNSSWLGYAVLGLLIVIAVVMVTARVSAWNRATAWKQFYAALHLEDEEAKRNLEIIASSTTGTIGVQARLALAQRQWEEGSTQVFTDKAQAIILLEQAVGSLLLVQNKTADPSLLQQAGFALGQCWEALAAARSGGDLSKAEAEYQRVAERWGDSFMGQRAKKQLALIRLPSTKMFIEHAAKKTIEPLSSEDFIRNLNFSDPIEPGRQIDFGTFGETKEETTKDEAEKTKAEEPKSETEVPNQTDNKSE